jgi:hypothetical protein
MSRYFIIVIAGGLIVLIALLLSLFSFHATRVPDSASRFGNICHTSRFSLQPKGECMATEAKETSTLIGSDKVAGTAVYGADDQEIGTIERVMIEKTSGRVSYPAGAYRTQCWVLAGSWVSAMIIILPWNALKYDTRVGGYRTGITVDQLNRAPRYASESGWDWGEPGSTKAVDDYYGRLI